MNKKEVNDAALLKAINYLHESFTSSGKEGKVSQSAMVQEVKFHFRTQELIQLVREQNDTEKGKLFGKKIGDLIHLIQDTRVFYVFCTEKTDPIPWKGDKKETQLNHFIQVF